VPSTAWPAGLAEAVSTDLIRLESSPAGVTTRRRIARSKLGSSALIRAEASGQEDRGQSLVTRRYAALRKKRRKTILTVLAVAIGVFPPVWIAYFIAWQVWRHRPIQKSMRLVRKAVRSLERGHTGVALKQLQNAHLLDPSNCDALYWMGLLMSRQNRAEEAVDALSLVSERIPGLPEVEEALVDAYLGMDEPEPAIFHAQRLMDSTPYATTSLVKLAEAFEAAGKLDLATQALEQAPIHKRTLSDELVGVHYRLGSLYEKQGESEQALQHFKRVYGRDITFKDVKARIEALEQDLSALD
jgi:tetratricopeptide (TPR) repeat protein